MHPDSYLWLNLAFIATTALTFFLFLRAHKQSKWFIIVSLVWLALQAIVSYSGFYTKTDSVPPRFVLLVLPPIFLFVILFLTRKGRDYIDSLDLKNVHWVHVVRIPVELCLLFMFYAGTIPELMTFEGRNFDILAGLTAPLIIWLYFNKKSISKTAVLVWNIVSVLLLANIVIHAVLSAPFSFQQLAFDQPNTAVLYFPFAWLPCYIVPVVLFCHLVAFRRIMKNA